MRGVVRIVGIDPGLAETGIGIVSGDGCRVDHFAYGRISTFPEAPVPDRLRTIYSKLMEVLDREHPDLMVVEDVFSLDAYPKSGILLGKVTGVLLLAGSHAKVPMAEIPVREAKHVLTGNGNASKMQLEKAVRNQLGAEKPIRPYHASDALGLALIGLYRYGQLIGRSGGLTGVQAGCADSESEGAS
ncbi:MAG: crossover junction endodeoxyribonuclease RuvC [Desulfobacterales bacterium]|jgi:crossover junction endodeoxyribonuclease RuvC